MHTGSVFCSAYRYNEFCRAPVGNRFLKKFRHAGGSGGSDGGFWSSFGGFFWWSSHFLHSSIASTNSPSAYTSVGSGPSSPTRGSSPWMIQVISKQPSQISIFMSPSLLSRVVPRPVSPTVLPPNYLQYSTFYTGEQEPGLWDALPRTGCKRALWG